MIGNPNQCTVLIIDQAKQAREIYRKSLLSDQDYTYTILEECTASGGLAVCQSQPIEGILLNYLLPDGDGLDFLSRLRQQSGDTCPPIVVIDEQGDEAIAVQAIKNGAEDYLVKRKLTPDGLRFTMRTAIENSRLRRLLQQSEERFHASVESILDCYGIYTAIRDEFGQIVDFRVEYVNAAACENNQLTRDQQLGKGLCEILPGHRESGLFDAYCQLVETGVPVVKESLVYADQYGQHHLVKAFDIRAAKLDDGFVATWRDVTTQVQARLNQQHQLEQERIVCQITQQIQQSLDLEVILQTTVDEMRQCLQSDRTFIYRFHPDWSGTVVVEATDPPWPSILNQPVTDTYFMDTGGEAYRQGRVQVVSDIYTAGLADCHVALLEQFQIRANLVVPILQGESLWGLMVASQCATPRFWEMEDVELLQQLAGHVGIAIQQAELYEQLQQELAAHQQARSAVSESEAQFRTLVANIPGAVYRCRHKAEWQGMFISDGIEAIAGYPAQDFAAQGSRTFDSIVAPEDQNRVAAQMEEAIQAQLPFELEYRLLHADGSCRWVYDKGQGSFDQHGNLQYVDGVILDISDRKRTEAALQEQERLLQLALSGAQAGTWNWEIQTDKISWSPENYDLYGLAPTQHPPQYDDWYQALHPDDRERANTYVMKVVEDRLPEFRTEYRIIHPQRGVRWLLALGRITFDPLGEPVWLSGINLDITDRQQIQQQLEEQVAERTAALQTVVQELQSTLENLATSGETIRKQLSEIESIYATAPVGLCFVDRHLKFVRINERLAEINGVSAANHIGRTLREVLPNLSDELERLFRQVIHTGTPILDYEISGTTPAHPTIERYWLASFYPLQDPQGYGLGVNCVTQEITDRKQAEFALQTSEAKYRQIIETATEGIWQVDAEGKTIFVNQQMATMLGYTPDEMMEKPLFDFMDEDCQAIALQFWQRRLEGVQEQHDFKFRHRNGAEVWAIVSGNPMLDESGQMIGALGMLTDITERKQVEQKIHEQAALLNITTDAIIVRDLNNRILFWNAGAERSFGWPAEEVIGQTTETLWTEPSAQQAEILHRVIQQEYWQGELQKRTKDHREIIVQSRWTLMRDEAGEPQSILTVDTDITEQRKLEAQFLRAQRLESLGTIASGITHDLNNILTPILAISQLLPKRLSNLSERDQSMLKIMEDNAKRGSELVKQILSFARGVEGKSTTMQLGLLLKEIEKIIQQTFPKNIDLNLELSHQDLGLVSADATQLHQVLMNLCVNSRDAMPNGGKLVLTAQNCLLDESYASLQPEAHPGPYLMITVADTGCGIPPEQLDQIFEPFFTTKDLGQGTGLGLSTVSRIIKNHGGFITVSSTLGEGTKFQVYLPTIPEEDAKVPERDELVTGHQEVILIVDDEPQIRDITQLLLERHNYRSITAQDGIEAIALYAQEKDKIDAILMDVQMPFMDGFIAARAIQRINPDIKIVASSGLPLNRKIIENNDYGIKSFLQKPYSVKELLSTLATVLQD